MPKKLRDWAEYYYNLGFNVTHIIPELNDPAKKNIYKAPTNNRQIITHRRQTIDELISYNWENSIGIGFVLGFSQIRAIDIDFSSDLKLSGKSKFIDIKPLIKEILLDLELPQEYEWTTLTPSGGAHVIFYSEEMPFETKQNTSSEFGEKKLKGLIPNKHILQKYPFLDHFEYRWHLHLNLPPSLDKNNIENKFLFEQPKCKPLYIKFDTLKKFIFKYSFEFDSRFEKEGFNLSISDYRKNHKFIDYDEVQISKDDFFGKE